MRLRKTIEAILILHTVLHMVHAGAHLYHGVPVVFQTERVGIALGYLFILVFFIVLPLWGWWQLRNKQGALGYYLLIVAMLPTWIYAFLYHFVLATPDYVCLFGATVAGRWFTWTAYSISIVDAGLLAFCIYALMKTRNSHLNIV